MQMATLVSDRSRERINDADLAHLAALAARDREARIHRRPRWEIYAQRVLLTALCQGGAQHFVDGRTGVKDFDVWTFYAALPSQPYPARWRTTADFGPSRFGRRESEPEGVFEGRRVDLIGRSIPASPNLDPVDIAIEYLTTRRTASARFPRLSRSTCSNQPDCWDTSFGRKATRIKRRDSHEASSSGLGQLAGWNLRGWPRIDAGGRLRRPGGWPRVRPATR